jgi:hypothetical protein
MGHELLIESQLLTSVQFPIRVIQPRIGAGQILALQGSQPPQSKSLDDMGSGQTNIFERLNMVNVTLHPLSHHKARIPHLIDNRHPLITFDVAFLSKINVEPFILETLLGGLNREINVVLLSIQGESN